MGRKIVKFVINNNGYAMKAMKPFILNFNEMPVEAAAEPGEVLLPLPGWDPKKKRPKLREGAQVVTGEPLMPGVYSTVTGTVRGIQPLMMWDRDVTAVRIQPQENEQIHADLTPFEDYMKAEPADLLDKLNRANLPFRQLPETVSTVVVSAVDTDPLHHVCHQILREQKDRIQRGLKLIKHITGAATVLFAVPQPLTDLVSGTGGDGITIVPIDPVYPNGLPELLIMRLASQYDLQDHLFLGVESLAAAVAALEDGTPYNYKIVSLTQKTGTRNLRVRIGTPLSQLLEGIEIDDHSRVIVNGLFKGYACFDLNIPVTHALNSVYIQEPADVMPDRNRQCMNCGRCVRACPVDLEINLIGRYAEFSIFDACDEKDVHRCVECGLCAYVCPAARSLVQLVRLAKKEIQGEKVS